MDILPLDIQAIVYRYVYAAVLQQLLQSYGTSLRLRYISTDEQPSIISQDAISDITYRMWFHPLCDDNGYTRNWKAYPNLVGLCCSHPLWRQAIKNTKKTLNKCML